jgi:hypothetical protein
MRILGAWIDDPTLVGKVDPPMLCVETDAYPDETQEPLRWDDGWVQAKYGPFILFDCEPNADITAGDYNVRFAGAYPPIVDIMLVVENQNYSGLFGLPLSRARQLVRKHCPHWRLYLNDNDAQQGTMTWIPQMAKPTCRWWMPQRIAPSPCGMTQDVVYVRKDGIDFPLCSKHLTDHNATMADRRRAITS